MVQQLQEKDMAIDSLADELQVFKQRVVELETVRS
jgi:hypothetical protein